MRLFIWLCLVASLLAIGCSPNLPPKDPIEVKKSIQIDRALRSPETPSLAASSTKAEELCKSQGGKIYYLDFPNATCQIDGKTIFNYFATFDSEGSTIIVGTQSFFRGENGGILQMAIHKYGSPKWIGSIALWYNPKRDIVMTIETRKKETILSFYTASAYSDL